MEDSDRKRRIKYVKNKEERESITYTREIQL